MTAAPLFFIFLRLTDVKDVKELQPVFAGQFQIFLYRGFQSLEYLDLRLGHASAGAITEAVGYNGVHPQRLIDQGGFAPGSFRTLFLIVHDSDVAGCHIDDHEFAGIAEMLVQNRIQAVVFLDRKRDFHISLHCF